MLQFIRCYFRLIIIALAVMIFPISSSADSSPIRFAVPNFPPYAYFQNGEITGLGVEKVKRYLEKMELNYEFRLVPNYGRALQELKSGHADGFFLATENEDRNQVATISDAVGMNNWSWFLPADSTLDPSDATFKETARISTHLKSNTHRWLLKNGYNVVYTPSDADSLVKTLNHERVSAVFLAEAVFWESCRLQSIDRKNFRQVIQSSRPFGIYIAKTYLEKNPDFMIKLNRVIASLPTIGSE